MILPTMDDTSQYGWYFPRWMILLTIDDTSHYGWYFPLSTEKIFAALPDNAQSKSILKLKIYSPIKVTPKKVKSIGPCMRHGKNFGVKICGFGQNRMLPRSVTMATRTLSLCFSKILWYRLSKYTVWEKSGDFYKMTLIQSLRKLILNFVRQYRNSFFLS